MVDDWPLSSSLSQKLGRILVALLKHYCVPSTFRKGATFSLATLDHGLTVRAHPSPLE